MACMTDYAIDIDHFAEVAVLEHFHGGARCLIATTSSSHDGWTLSELLTLVTQHDHECRRRRTRGCHEDRRRTSSSEPF